MSADTITTPHPPLAFTPSRAARELGLKRGELDLAVHLGLIRTVPDEGGGGRRVPRSEIDRLRTGDGVPESLQDRVRVVGTTEGADVMNVSAGRFTRLARLGVVAPVKWYLNRYRAVVWLYLADELKQFAADEKNAPLLNARRMPEGPRGLLDAGLDLRPRNWRGRHRGFLLRLAEDPWESAGAVAAFLDPVQVGEIVPDPYERSHLIRFRPGPPASGAPGSPAALIAERIMTADDPDEISLLRADLAAVLAEARERRPAPRPTAKRAPAPEHRGHVGPSRTEEPSRAEAPGRSEKPGRPDNPERPEEPQPPRGFLGRLRRRTRRATTT
ncbi:hypothetical protein ACM01_08220 [Streptomyces viridochromogenes]|uniref:Uncharacterized protein n=1 Tax=Streptomyces viridochromogenes TaxID=1938 RepID=A0A0J7ZJX9_STRVR|nr:DUF6397 family protein [Streptomyces viridochromogenes]KMS75737.1 hypothetical protein ACM01_08220 [Streptomyces viridochromogenes]KOG16937.1 hypothetical protein ADK36_25750 [Streptomyces viridochromogenes]KOG18233.1 hypothetical protein ADK35_22605 [Streptomyces viridochromogenes]